MIRFSILTLFPDVFVPLVNTSILKRAQEKGLVTIRLINIRDFATDSYKTVDDRPYGGGVGMVMRVDILYNAIKSLENQPPTCEVSGTAPARSERKILLDPKGRRFNQRKAKEFSRLNHLILVCGHYEGVDARVEKYVDETVSIGDFVLTGGEIAAMAIVDSVVRLLQGTITEGATATESFEGGLLEYPQYTRPEIFDSQKVPEILLSGNHKKIEEWRKSKQKKISKALPRRSRA